MQEEAPSNDEQEKYLKKRKNFGDDQITAAISVSTHSPSSGNKKKNSLSLYILYTDTIYSSSLEFR